MPLLDPRSPAARDKSAVRTSLRRGARLKPGLLIARARLKSGLRVFRGGQLAGIVGDQQLFLGRQRALDDVEVLKGSAGADGDAVEGVVGDLAGDVGLL